MKVITKGSILKTCTRCESVVEMFNYEMHKIQPTDDYDPQDIGRIYWRCPVCGISNWVETDDTI